jgi:prevent-host-death family protein
MDIQDIEDIGAFEAKTRLSELLDQVARGRRYRITKRGKPVAELRPVETRERRPAFGRDRGRVVIGNDFDGPLGDFDGYR